MKFTLLKKQSKQRLWILFLLLFVAIFLTACGFSTGGLQNLFQAQEPTSTATEITILDQERLNSPTDTNDNEKITITTSKPEHTKTNKPNGTASHTTTLSATPSLTQTPSITFTNIVVFIPPTNTQIPPTNTRILPSNTPVPPSATPKPTDRQVTEPPTQEPTEEPTEEPTQEPTDVPTEEPTEDPTEEPTDVQTEEPPEAQVCYTLTLSHKGQGTDPVANPKYSQGCPKGQYVAGQFITLSHAIPDANWEIKRWEGTLNNISITNTNSVKMPASAHTAKVIYGKCG